jgi:hypothetical protein
MENRRQRRGDTLESALKYQLAACVEDEGLAAMVLADDAGLCLASWGGRDMCEEAAARAPLARERRPGLEAARRVRFGKLELYLCAVGGQAAGRFRSLERSASGVSRILAGWIAPS